MAYRYIFRQAAIVIVGDIYQHMNGLAFESDEKNLKFNLHLQKLNVRYVYVQYCPLTQFFNFLLSGIFGLGHRESLKPLRDSRIFCDILPVFVDFSKYLFVPFFTAISAIHKD